MTEKSEQEKKVSCKHPKFPMKNLTTGFQRWRVKNINFSDYCCSMAT